MNLFWNLTPRIELFVEYNSKNWTYFQYDSKYWFCQTKNFDSKNSTFFFLNMTQRTEPFFFSDSKNWIFWMTLRTQLFFSNVTQKKIVFFERYSKNWTLFNKSWRIEFFLIRLHELNPSLIWLKDFVLKK